MRYSQLFLKTRPAVEVGDSINAQLLTRGGFIEQVMAGVYAYLPLGWRVLNNIENIVREEMDLIGTELLLPALSPKAIWEQTGRIDTIDVMFEARGANELSMKRNSTAFILNSTHEDVLTPIAQKIKVSYRDLPFAVYQIQTKFRNEERPKSGLLRGREFRMKDLYSFHATEKDFSEYYEAVKEVYMKAYTRIGLGESTHIVVAGGGAFTSNLTHEFDCECETGEDTIYHDEETDTYYNAEVVPAEIKARARSFSASEVGNIFPLGTKYSDAFGYHYLDENGNHKPVYMGSYGLGTSRVMGVLVEKFNDDKGIIWPESVAPATVHLVGLQMNDTDVRNRAEKVYATLQDEKIDVIFDDRVEASPGQKLSDADLIGIPWRLVVSQKTDEQVEVKRRDEAKTARQDLNEFIKSL